MPGNIVSIDPFAVEDDRDILYLDLLIHIDKQVGVGLTERKILAVRNRRQRQAADKRPP